MRSLGLASLLALALANPAFAQDQPLGPPESRRLDVFYTGFTGGLASGKVDFAELRPLFQPGLERDFEAGGLVSDNVFRRGQYLLYTDEGPLTLEDFQSFFGAGPVEVTKLGPVPMLASDFAFALSPRPRPGEAHPLDWLVKALHKDGGFADAHLHQGTRYWLTNAAGMHLYLCGLDGQPPPEGAQQVLAAACSARSFATLSRKVVKSRHDVARTWAETFDQQLEDRT